MHRLVEWGSSVKQVVYHRVPAPFFARKYDIHDSAFGPKRSLVAFFLVI
jgi:hypothetical protein